MKKITSLFILLTLLISSYTINATEIEAPAEPEIKGKIIDMETDGPLEYATVSPRHLLNGAPCIVSS